MSSNLSNWLKKGIKLPPRKKRPPPSIWVRWFSKAINIFFGVLFVYFIIWRVSLYFEIKHQFALIQKAGLPTTGQELNAWRPKIEDADNAAGPLTEAFDLLKEFPKGESNSIIYSITFDRRTGWNSRTNEVVSEYVRMNRPALLKAHQAVSRPRTRFDTDLSYGPDTQLPHLGKLKTLSQLSTLEAVLDVDGGRTNEWPTNIDFNLKLASTLDEEPVLLSCLVRDAIIQQAARTTEYCLNRTRLDKADCQHLQKAFLAMEKTNVFPSALMGERAMFIPVFRLSRAEIQRNTDQKEDAPDTPLPPHRYAGKPNPFLWLSGLFERELNVYLEVMATNIQLAALPAPENLIATNSIALLGKHRSSQTYFMTSLLLPSFDHVFLRDAATHAQIRLASTALAVERFRIAHQTLPEDLKSLVPAFLDSVPTDPFDGAPLRYRLLKPGYEIYSVGTDCHDDGGRELPLGGKKSSDTNSYDLVIVVDQ